MQAHFWFFIILIIRLSVQGRQVGAVLEFAARLQQDGDELNSLLCVVFFLCWELLMEISVLANSGVFTLVYCTQQSINMLCAVEIKT